MVPTRRAATSLSATDFRVPETPSSFSITMKVATHGKYIARTTEAITNCSGDISRGANMPIPTSFLKKPMINAVAASLGSPSSPETTGLKSRPMICIKPER